jgi:hypothetical protein
MESLSKTGDFANGKPCGQPAYKHEKQWHEHACYARCWLDPTGEYDMPCGLLRLWPRSFKVGEGNWELAIGYPKLLPSSEKELSTFPPNYPQKFPRWSIGRGETIDPGGGGTNCWYKEGQRNRKVSYREIGETVVRLRG